jgi:ferredoxin
MKVRVDQHNCIGAGNCAQLAPQIFGQREDDGVVILLTDSPDAGQEANLAKAVKICPAQAISVSEG